MTEPTPTHHNGLVKRLADFTTIAEALDYAAQGRTGLNFYSGKGVLTETLPYATLRAQALLLARQLLGTGLQPGDRVGLLAESDGDFARAFFACQYAGLVPAPLPLPAAFGGKEGYISFLRRMIQGADAHAVFGPAVLADWLAEAVEGLELKCAGVVSALDGAPMVPEAALPAPESLAYLQFSSGSTRFPLGVAVTQTAFMANAHYMAKYGLRVNETDRCTSWLPYYHDMGLVGFLLMPMACQLSVDILPTREFARRPLLWLQLITRNKGSISFSPSFGYELCARRARTASTEGIDLSSWRRAGIGGDMIRPAVLTRFAERFAANLFQETAFIPCYGMAEATLALSFSPDGQGAREDAVDGLVLEREHRAVPANETSKRTRHFVICGQMLPEHDVEVRGADGALLAEREVGHIFVRGPSLMLGYFGAPEETARVLSAEGWLDTGDLGYLIDGQLVITGRAKDLVIVNGRNVWPQDLEWAAEAEVPSLRSGDVAVFSVDNGEDEEVVVLVQCRVTDPAAREALALELTRFFRGRQGLETRVVLVPPHSLPQTSSGKLSRSRARMMYLDGAFLPRATATAAE
ncbi:fatty acyl-AMP ligase [Acidocella aminolytica]|jgi:fatty-acyl-CoA synthase|uniref:Acyl-CoA synthetase n=1 Tax=Acidocella aminolytica 101 = DSM 11237 TaxID=1120923 RepID=A0A0D6PFB2_9PROT|nr:fatty acyl-AMP ligase [Acidocella aminolytica]GAN80440.1 acyl-CoA synthetase [Acidocella aminolytica 101 = DSM 11237]GBQ35783.1 acyl-CoA synthetase [Acidocella aminolytica 101 = DSM 11237]SHE96470.1 fatty-acyl-CoA synthase [Acidocella aminolytica 101 = DSM 11237]